MKRYILTGTPGAGKTVIIKELERMVYNVVHEAATALIASEQAKGNLEPWTQISFIDDIVAMQQQKQLETETIPGTIQFFDRSPICTHALSVYLGIPPSKTLLAEILRIREQNIYENKVFFIENLGFCEPTDARKISFEDSLHFEKIHEEVYRSHGYELIKIPPKSTLERVNHILQLVHNNKASNK